MKKLSLSFCILGVFFLGPFSITAQNKQDPANIRAEDQLRIIEYRTVANISLDFNQNQPDEKIAKILDTTLDVGMAPGETQKFNDIRIGGYHPESFYFPTILEKPNFMTFQDDGVSGNFSATFADFTLIASNNAVVGDHVIRVKYSFHFGVPPTSDEILTINLTIANAPTADFSGTPRSGTEPLTVNFTDQSSGNVTSWSWNFGDGQSSTQQNPSHTYQNAGSFTVRLTVSGAGGSNTRTRNDYITVNPAAPTAEFVGSPTSGTAPLTVSFTDQSTGNITSRSWDFGDGQSSTQQNPSHTYQNAGTYTVKLTVTGPGGSDSRTRNNYITVNEPEPTADFTGSPTSGPAPLTVNFSDQSIGNITSRSWDFGDGQTSTQENPSHTYQNPATYTVKLTVTGPGGSNTRSRDNYITVNIPPPQAEFTGTPTTGLPPLIVSFTDQSTGEITTRSWDFGDGQSSTEQNPSHTYENSGTFTVKLTVTGPGGSHTRTRINYITVNPGLPAAEFVGSPTSGMIPLTVNFSDQSSGDITSWSWDYGDGDSGTEQNPLHTYQNAGTYNVTLTVTGPGGSDTKTRSDYITATAPILNPPINLTASMGSGKVILNWNSPGTATNNARYSNSGMPGSLHVSYAKQYFFPMPVNRQFAYQFMDAIAEVEPNNRPEQAQVLTGPSPVVINGNAEVSDVGNLSIRLGDGTRDDLEDLFIVTIVSEGLSITLTDINSDLDLYLLNDSANTVIKASLAIGLTAETIDSTNLKPGTYFIAVSIFDSAPVGPDTSPYTLTVNGTLPGAGPELQAYHVYRSLTSPVAIVAENRVGAVDKQTTRFEDNNLENGTYFYAVTAVYEAGESEPSNEVSVLITSIERGDNELPTEFQLSQNYPNPFNPETIIVYKLPESSQVKLYVYNLAGQKVATLVDSDQSPGVYSVHWDGKEDSGRSVTSGLYFYRLQAGGFVQLRRMLLIR